MRFILWAIGLSCLMGLVSSKNGGTNVPNVSIVGGIPAALGEFPYLCLLILGNTLCGGSLIGPSHVLTAAHCLSGKSQASVNTFTVRLNALALNGSTPGTISTGVKKFIIHEKYSSSTFDNDVALLVLNAPVKNVAVIALPPSTSKPAKPAVSASGYANTKAIIAGWGTTSSGGSLSQVLLKTNVTIQDNSLSNYQYGSSFLGNDKLCASAPGFGDSGGPVIVGGVQVGIASWGNGCALSNNIAAVYTRVSTYVNWIQTTRANNPS